jgi:hypothetical protein
LGLEFLSLFYVVACSWPAKDDIVVAQFIEQFRLINQELQKILKF